VPVDSCSLFVLIGFGQRELKAAKEAGAGQSRFFYSQGRGGLVKDDREAARLFKLAAD
jgi:hypothetical protein